VSVSGIADGCHTWSSSGIDFAAIGPLWLPIIDRDRAGIDAGLPLWAVVAGTGMAALVATSQMAF